MKKKAKKTETEIVQEYVDRIIKGKASRGHTDKRFDYTKKSDTVNKEMWLDTDFFFSVVFQSSIQKYAFLEALHKKLGVTVENFDKSQIQIINGLKIAESLGIELKKESALEPPVGNLDLRPYVLDDEKI